MPHPVPAKRAKGIKKSRLEPRAAQAETVRQVFGWRVNERLGYQAIADRLNHATVGRTAADGNKAAAVW
ncbi:hypothetical protein MU582_15940 [Nocardioidaceae bacterium SCSIO 66511]|nr:hypothetical protein MU582_15940 [Nocardioidaceae bacterium SCSIO 66511]